MVTVAQTGKDIGARFFWKHLIKQEHIWKPFGQGGIQAAGMVKCLQLPMLPLALFGDQTAQCDVVLKNPNI